MILVHTCNVPLNDRYSVWYIVFIVLHCNIQFSLLHLSSITFINEQSCVYYRVMCGYIKFCGEKIQAFMDLM